MPIARFVDAHMHLWSLDTLCYPWLSSPFSDDGPNGNVSAIATTYLPDDYYAEASGFPVSKLVHVEAGVRPDLALAETRWLEGLRAADQGPHALVAQAQLDDPDCDRLLEAQAAFKPVRGVRHIINWHPDRNRTYTPRDLLQDEAFHWGFACLKRHELSFDLQLYPNQMQAAYDLLRRHPDTPVMINHMGTPILSDPESLPLWREGIAKLAQLPQVHVKISGFGFIDRRWTTPTMRPLVLELIDRFGPQRCAFASDFPTDRLFNTYGRALDAFDQITADFTPTERQALFAETAERFYRI